MASVYHKFLGVIVGFLMGCLCATPSTGAPDFSDEPIETLAVIEVPATAILEEKQHLVIPKPEHAYLLPLPFNGLIPATITKAITVPQNPLKKIVRDSTGDRKGVRKPVRPIKAERPPYPQVARKRGWEGTVVVRLTVNKEGFAERITTQKSSGFPSLDESATQAVKTWRFDPAKDGEFPIPVTVDLPIRFDLEEQQ